MVRIIQSDSHIGKSLGLSRLRTGEDHILHGGTSELFYLLFTEHPADCIGNIALSASVRANDAGNSVVEFKYDLISKGFESLYFDTL